MRVRGLEELILSMKYVKGGKLYLRGVGSFGKKLRKLVSKHQLNNRVVFLEPVALDELVNALRFFGIGIVAYKPISFNNRISLPNKLFEYQMAGFAILSSDLPVIKIYSKNIPMVSYLTHHNQKILQKN